MFIKYLSLVLIFSLTSTLSKADFRNSEALLYPSGFSTADTLSKSEIYFSPQGWVSLGLTDQWTLTWDWFLIFGGIPALQSRHAVANDSYGGNYSIEAYGVYFPKDIPDERDPYFKVQHKRGGISYLRINRSQDLKNNWRIHFYGGATYSDYEKFEPTSKSTFLPRTYSSFVVPDYGIAFEYEMNSWAKLNINTSSGNTFVLFDQITHKTMSILGFYLSPFNPDRHGFLKNFRLELNAIWIHIPDAEYKKFYPVYPVIAWQWQTAF